MIEDWRPRFDASVYALVATTDGKLIVGGDFRSVNGQPFTAGLAALDPSTGEVVPTWRSRVERPWSDLDPVVRALAVYDGHIYAAGNFSHHESFASRTRVYKAIRVSEADGSLDIEWMPQVTGAGLWALGIAPDGSRVTLGGDGQAIEIASGIVYNACPCLAGRAWLNSFSWPTPSNGAIRRDANGIVAFTAEDFGYVGEFYPEIYYENGDGPWDLHMDDRGCRWVGGDVFRLDTDQPYRWARGFMRLCRDDAMAPTTPTDVAIAMGGRGGTDATLTWQESTDDRGVAGYKVFRDGELVATVDEATFTDIDVDTARV